MKPPYSRRYHRSNIKRFMWIFLLGLFALLLNIPTPSLAQQDSISIGDTVEVTSRQGLRLRTEPGINTSVIVTLPYQTQMRVIGGPRTNVDGLTWWELDGQSGRGWAAENYLRVVNGAPATDSVSDGSGCEQPYPAIQYCAQKDKSIYSILIDLNNPHVRFETIMANGTKSVNTSNRELVSSMGDKRKLDGAVVVINADYFGGGHGPEGFTVVNGERLDGIDNGDDDEGAVYRSSIAFSKSELDGGSLPITVNIQRFPQDRFTLDENQMFNAIGGGPQIVFTGAWDWKRGRNQDPYKSYHTCETDIVYNDVINGECFRNTGDWDINSKRWTVVGKTIDGRLIILLSSYSNVKSALEVNKVQEAIKLDGGGSSQLWYNGQPIVPGDGRKVANGLAVFYKNDYEIIEQPTQWLVVVSGETFDIQITLKNTGADTWTQKDYALNIANNPLDMSFQIILPHDVHPGEQVTVTWQSPPVDRTWGIYNLDLQLVDHGDEFPMDSMSSRVIVMPQDLAEKKEELEQEIRDWIADGVEDMEQAIREWITRQLMGYWERFLYDLRNCNLSIAFLIIASLIIYRRSH